MPKKPPKRLPPLHPGEVLREEFLVPLGLSPGALARTMGVPRTRVERTAAETSGITADTALRLGKRSAPRRSSGSICRTATMSRQRSA